MSFQRALTRVLSGQINFKHKQCSRIGGFVKELQRKAVIHRCSGKAVRKIVVKLIGKQLHQSLKFNKASTLQRKHTKVRILEQCIGPDKVSYKGRVRK